MGGSYAGYDDALKVSGTGLTVVSGGASASQTIPNNANGARAWWVYIQSTGNAYIKFTRGAGTCTTNDLLLTPNNYYIFAVRQFDTISYLQETVGAKINITPLEG